MRTLQVQFSSGRDVLGHYWGLLSGGGLAIELNRRTFREVDPVTDEGQPPAFTSGEKLRVEVHVLSIKKTYLLDVQVVDVRTADKGPAQLMVSFLPDTTPDELLDAAWADGCDAPQRRSRRLPTHTQIRFDCLDGSGMEGKVGHLLNLSSGGCCVEGSGLPPPGTSVMLTTMPETGGEASAVRLVGRVRWTERPDTGGLMGIEFLRALPEVASLLTSLGPPREK